MLTLGLYYKYSLANIKHTLLLLLMYIYHELIDALSTHMTHIDLNTIFYTHIEQSLANAIRKYDAPKSKLNEFKPFIHT